MVYYFTVVALCALGAITTVLSQSPPPNAPTPLPTHVYDAGVKLYTWEQLKCPGDPTEKHELKVDLNITFAKEIRAYKLSRVLTSEELLDFSQTNVHGDLNDKCGLFVDRTNPTYPNANGPPEVLQKQTCYQFAGEVSAQCVHLHYP